MTSYFFELERSREFYPTGYFDNTEVIQLSVTSPTIDLRKDTSLIWPCDCIPVSIPVGGVFTKPSVRMSKSIEVRGIPRTRERLIVERLYYHSQVDGLIPFKVRYRQSEGRGMAYVVPMAITHAHNNFTNVTYFDPRIIALNSLISAPVDSIYKKIANSVLDRAYVGSPGSDHIIVPDRSTSSVLDSFYRMVADIQDRPCHEYWSDMQFEEFVIKHLHHRPPVDDPVIQRYQDEGQLSKRALSASVTDKVPFVVSRVPPLSSHGAGAILHSPQYFTSSAWAIERACITDFELCFHLEEGVCRVASVRLVPEDIRSLRDPYRYYFSPEADHALDRLLEMSSIARSVARDLSVAVGLPNFPLKEIRTPLTINVRKSIFEDAVITIVDALRNECVCEIHLDIALMSLCSLSVGPDIDIY